MINTSQWCYSFAASALLLLWTLVLWFGLSSYLSMGPAFYLLYLTMGIFVLLMLVMIMLVFSARTRSLSFGLAIPLLGFHIAVFIVTGADWWYIHSPQWLVIYIPSVVAFFTVGIIYMTRNRPAGGQQKAVEQPIG